MATRIFLFSLAFILAVKGQAVCAEKDICDSNSFYISFNIGLNGWNLPLNPDSDKMLVCALDALRVPIKYYLNMLSFPLSIFRRKQNVYIDENTDIYNGCKRIMKGSAGKIAGKASSDLVKSIKRSISTIKGDRGSKIWVNVSLTRCEDELHGVFHKIKRMNWHKYAGGYPCSIGSKNGFFGIGYGLSEDEAVLEIYEAIPFCLEEASKKLYNGELQLEKVKNGLINRLFHIKSCYAPIFNTSIN